MTTKLTIHVRQCERCPLVGKPPAPATVLVVMVMGALGERPVGYVCAEHAADFPERCPGEVTGYELRAIA